MCWLGLCKTPTRHVSVIPAIPASSSAGESKSFSVLVFFELFSYFSDICRVLDGVCVADWALGYCWYFGWSPRLASRVSLSTRLLSMCAHHWGKFYPMPGSVQQSGARHSVQLWKKRSDDIHIYCVTKNLFANLLNPYNYKWFWEKDILCLPGNQYNKSLEKCAYFVSWKFFCLMIIMVEVSETLYV